MEESCSSREVTEMTSMSYRSAQRILSELYDRKYVKKGNGKYHITIYGYTVLRQYLELLESIEFLKTNEPLFVNLPSQRHLPNLDWIRESDIVLATTNSSTIIESRYQTELREYAPDTLYSVTPVLSVYQGSAQKELLENGAQLELIIDENLLDIVTSITSSELRRGAEDHRFDLRVCETDINFGLTFTDDRGFLKAYDSDDHLKAYVSCSDSRFLDWCHDLYEWHRERSRPFEASNNVTG